MLSTPEIVTRPDQPFAAIRISLDRGEIPSKAPPLIGEVAGWLAGAGRRSGRCAILQLSRNARGRADGDGSRFPHGEAAGRRFEGQDRHHPGRPVRDADPHRTYDGALAGQRRARRVAGEARYSRIRCRRMPRRIRRGPAGNLRH